MTWTIITDPLNSLPLSALLAALPIFYLFWALAVKRMKGHWAAISAVGFALAIAIAGYGMPAKYALLATFDGMLFGLWPVAWIVLTAVFIYNLSVRTGQFEIIKNSLASISDDRRMQALLIAFFIRRFSGRSGRVRNAGGNHGCNARRPWIRAALCGRRLPAGKYGPCRIRGYRNSDHRGRSGFRSRYDGHQQDGGPDAALP